MKKIILFLLLSVLSFAQNLNKSDESLVERQIFYFSYDADAEALRFIGVGSVPDTNLNKFDGSLTTRQMLFRSYDAVNEALRFVTVGGAGDTSAFSYTTRYIVDQNGDTVAFGLNEFLAATELFTPRVNTDTLSKSSGSEIITVSDVRLIRQGVDARFTFETAGLDIWSHGIDFTDGRYKVCYGGILGTNTALSINSADRRVGIGIEAPVSLLHVYENTIGTGSNTGVTVENDGGGDARLGFFLTSAKRANIGLDNSDDDKFKMTYSTQLGANDFFIAENNNIVNFPVGVITDSIDARIGIFDSLGGGSSPLIIIDSVIAPNFISGGASIVTSKRKLIKSLDELIANADSFDVGNGIIHLKPSSEIHYVFDETIVSPYSLGEPRSVVPGEVMISFNNPANWTYVGTNAIFELKDACNILFFTPIRFIHPDGMFLHINNPGTNGLVIFDALGGSIFTIGKEIGYIENGLTAAINLPVFQAIYEQGWTFESSGGFIINEGFMLPEDVARIDYASQTVNFAIGDTADGASSGAWGVIVRDIDNGTTGTLTLGNISGDFQNGEIITGRITGSATTSSLLQNNIFASISGTIGAVSLQNLTLSSFTGPVFVNNANILYIDPTTIETTVNTVAGFKGIFGFMENFFAEGSKDQTDPYWKMFNNSGVPNSTTKAKLSFDNNAATTTITTIEEPTPINVIWADGEIEEEVVFQDSVIFYSTGDSIQTTFNHGLNDSNIVVFHTYTGTLAGGLSDIPNYYVNVISPTAYTVSLTPGGSTVDLTTDGSGTNYYRHTEGVSQLGWAIYVGLEPISVGTTGWITILGTTGTAVQSHATVMKSDTSGNIISFEEGSFVTVSSATANSSNITTIVPLSHGEGLLTYIGNHTGTQDLVGTDARISIKK